MARVTVRNRLTRDFGMIPNGLWASGLTFAAKGVFAYLCSLRDGAFPYVAEMESALGLGRDARRKAFRELEAFGCIGWDVQRDAAQRIVAKTLWVDPLAFVQPAEGQGPESQADGSSGGGKSHAPEIPAGGKSTPAETENRPCGDGKSGDTLRQEKQERARQARKAACATADRLRHRSPPEGGGGAASVVDGLTAGERYALSTGKAAVVNGVPLVPTDAEYQRLASALAETGQHAVKGCEQ